MFNPPFNPTLNSANPSRLLRHAGYAHVLRCSFCLNTYAAKPGAALSEARCVTCSRKFKYIAVLRRLRYWWRSSRLRTRADLLLSGDV